MPSWRPGQHERRLLCTTNDREGLPGSVGNTPLIEIESLSKATGCTILGKAEFLNPGGSVKDRAALAG